LNLCRSTGILLVSANPSLTSGKNLLPWCGQAFILATGVGSETADNTRTVYVQIKETDSLMSSDTSSKEEIRERDDDVTDADPQLNPKITKLQILTNPIDFETVATGSSASE